MQFIDLAAQQARIKDAVDANIQRVRAHGQYIKGPEVTELEQKLSASTGAKLCIAVANGTDALQIALMAAGVPPGSCSACARRARRRSCFCICSSRHCAWICFTRSGALRDSHNHGHDNGHNNLES